MNKYIYTGGSNLLSIKDDNYENISTIYNNRLNIDWTWVIEEDGTFVANGKKYDVKTGDIVLVLYANYKEKRVPTENREKVRDFIIIRNEDFYNNYKLNKEYYQNLKIENCGCCDSPVQEA